jgi:transposase
MAAWLGLVPRQHSSGGKQLLLGISKRGDVYLRTLLIHGARSVVRMAKAKIAAGVAQPSWLHKLLERKHANVAAVALANKNARIVWALLAHGREYEAGYAMA